MGDHDQNTPYDIRTKLLEKLPLKSLFTFNSVSRPWSHLISDIRAPCLLHVEESHDDNRTFRFTVTDTQGKLIKQFTPPLVPRNFGHLEWVYHSNSDLACFYTSGNFVIYLCNPATEQILPLPRASPSKYGSIGFGYSSKANEYKVVNLFTAHRGDIDISCEIYSMGENHSNSDHSWRTISEKSPHMTMETAACVDEVLHWMPCNPFGEPSVAVVSFDLNTEKFMTMPISQKWIDLCKIWYCAFIRELAGKLCLVCSVGHEDAIQVWMVKDYNEGTLEKLWEINLENDLDYYSRSEIIPIGYIKNDDNVDSEINLVLQTLGVDDGRIKYYNTHDQAKSCTSVKWKTSCYGTNLCLYWHTLGSPKTWPGPWLPNSSCPLDFLAL